MWSLSLYDVYDSFKATVVSDMLIFVMSLMSQTSRLWWLWWQSVMFLIIVVSIIMYVLMYHKCWPYRASYDLKLRSGSETIPRSCQIFGSITLFVAWLPFRYLYYVRHDHHSRMAGSQPKMSTHFYHLHVCTVWPYEGLVESDYCKRQVQRCFMA